MQAWENFVNAQGDQLGAETVDKWLRTLKVIDFDACNLYLEAKDSFQAAWFEEHIRPKLRAQLLNNNNRQIKVHLTAAEEPLPAKKKKAAPAPPAPALEFRSDALNPLATFDHYVASSANKIPFQFLKQLESELGAFNPVYISGSQGVGKTHLLMALAAQLKQKGLSVLYVHAETFTEHVVSAIRTGSMQEFRKTYRNSDALIIDDVHLFARRNATQEELFHTFNTLHTNRRQIILSSNLHPQHLKEIEPRLVSRFEWGITLHLEKPVGDALKELLLQRSQALAFPLSQELLECLLQTFPGVKALNTALETVILRSHLEKIQTPGLEAAKGWLAPLMEKERQNALTPEKIIRTVAHFYGIKAEDLLGKAQTHECALPRQIGMYLCRKELHLPYLKIGALFSRDHSTVMTSFRQIEKKIENKDKEMCCSISEILRILG